MFSGKTKQVVIDDEDLGRVSVEIRKLSWKSLRKARQARTIEQASELRAFGGDLMRAMQSPELEAAAQSLATKKKDVKALAKERYDAHDQAVTLVAGIESWSCEAARKLSPEAIDALDPETAQKLHEEILDYSLGPIDEKEAAEVPKG